MTEIQLKSGSSSASTHRLTQASHTLNRRYVERPSNLAIDEAAHDIKPRTAPTTTPSRLVNLRVHASDLAKIEALAQTPSENTEMENPAASMVPRIVEFGTASQEADIYNSQTSLSQLVPAEAVAEEPVAYTPIIPDSAVYEQPMAQIPEESDFAGNFTDTQPDQETVPAISSSSDIDTQSLAMSIAADYAQANFEASVTEASELTTLPAADSGSIDTIARAASEAIAAIRTATDPEEVADQVASLKNFANNIRVNSATPEMLELSDTIEKFVSVAMKSSRVQEEVAKKEAEAKKSQSAVKISAKKPAAKPTTSKRSVTTTKPLSSTRRVAQPAVAARPLAKHARKVAPKLKADDDQALRKALRSVAAMDDEPDTTAKRRAVRAKKKGTSKRLALAFFCALICVSAVVYLVASSMPDISVKVAAMQTGIEASYPAYIPRDFSLNDVSSEEGKISISFKGPDRAAFVLSEEKSSWDSTTLLRNYVEPTWNTNYITTHEQGITIYISGSNAAWVNGGVLYKINTTSGSLTKKQLRNIVTSM